MLRTTFALTALALATTPALAGPAAPAPSWAVNGAQSRLGFSGKQTGTPFAGRFTRYQAAIVFDPAHPETARIAVVIDLASATTGDKQRDQALPGKDWFDIVHFPQARFVSTAVKRTGTSAYVATGNLTIRGVTKAVNLPFTLAVAGNNARARGHLQLVRSAFGIGQGTWSTGQWVALEVGVDVDIVATRR